MFASCLPDVLSMTSKCVIECNARLAGMYARAFPAAVVRGGRKTDALDWVRDIGAVDFQAPIGDLPRYLRPSRDAFPRRRAYLTAEAGAVARWQSQLAALGPGPSIGFCWRGGSVRKRRRWNDAPAG
jgi:hypothetical protein